MVKQINTREYTTEKLWTKNNIDEKDTADKNTLQTKKHICFH